MKPTRLALLALLLACAPSAALRADVFYVADNRRPALPADAKSPALIYRVSTTDGAKTVFAEVPGYVLGLAVDRAGNVFISSGDSENGIVLKFTPDGQRRTFAAGFKYPGALALDPAGNLYLAALFPPAPGEAPPFIPQIGGVLQFNADGTASRHFATGFEGQLTSLAFDAKGNLYAGGYIGYAYIPEGPQGPGTEGVVDSISRDGQLRRFIGGDSVQFVDGAFRLSPGSLSFVSDLAVNKAGELFVADFEKQKIFAYRADGSRRKVARGLTPAHLAFDSFDNLYATDFSQSALIRLASNGTRTVISEGFESPGPLAFDPTSAPMVSISTDRASLSRSADEIANITLTRTGDLSKPLSVLYRDFPIRIPSGPGVLPLGYITALEGVRKGDFQGRLGDDTPELPD